MPPPNPLSTLETPDVPVREKRSLHLAHVYLDPLNQNARLSAGVMTYENDPPGYGPRAQYEVMAFDVPGSESHMHWITSSGSVEDFYAGTDNYDTQKCLSAFSELLAYYLEHKTFPPSYRLPSDPPEDD